MDPTDGAGILGCWGEQLHMSPSLFRHLKERKGVTHREGTLTRRRNDGWVAVRELTRKEGKWGGINRMAGSLTNCRFIYRKYCKLKGKN